MGRLGWIVLLGLWLAAAVVGDSPKRKAKEEKPPEIVLTKIAVTRDASVVRVDGLVKNTAGKAVRGVVLYFEFLDSDGRMITRKSITVIDDELEDGETEEFMAQTPNPPRAIRIRLDAEDSQGRYLRVDRPGPYPIH
jgi:hypothetical protein